VRLASGAHTIGYWQNKNGQGIIKAGATASGACKSATWVRQYKPFQDLGSKSTCTQVATYVTDVIRAASSSGSALNPMLKAQMLATALSVYFSDPSLGGNKIGAPLPIGAVTVDLKSVCIVVDAPSGTGTCSGLYQDASAAFGGAASRSVSQLLSHAGGQSNVGGSSWYGNVKATQQLAKNVFDAINNNLVFGPL
jgi:hypothetical protein